ncbi:molybdenum cofactor guanylyltransferase [Corynebacterium sp. TAE3-ERU2]|uniref:molybdenum cofactor guanylyltransferase n=1 Tax=Corynebacterium sp. TAE3-ERU2 TaxID=2849497 RepID=UPI001C43B202|nr:NTP transferase domain-containing protein [Corynebacterium sp. TAE3-ERU2]MBV7301168.1 NTP transferase domain-containing protein [Corynebacterium sp. TAE3-ERU2]
MSAQVDVILLAGGRGSRMGGRDKATVEVAGRRLIDHCLATIEAIAEPAAMCVVTTRPVELPETILRATERPAFAGPVAAIAAGAQRLRADRTPSPTTLVLAVDAPHSAQLYPQLAAALTAPAAGGENAAEQAHTAHSADTAGGDVALVRSSDGHRQPLCALWRTASLEQAVAAVEECAGAAVSALMKNQRIITVPGDGSERDYDTLAALEEFPPAAAQRHD